MAAMTSSFVGKALAVKVNKISKVRAQARAQNSRQTAGGYL